jgi:hypothetical protein
MNVYGKLCKARQEFHKLELKKSGWNPHSKFKFFELGDFLLPAQECLMNQGLVGLVTFDHEFAYLYVFETDGDGSFKITSPMPKTTYTKEYTDKHGVNNTFICDVAANLPGCHPIQNLGAVETYQRRYLWVDLMEIVEHDALDVAEPVEEGEAPKKTTKKAAPKKEAAPDQISTEAEAGAFVDGMLLLGKGMSKSNAELDDLMKKNTAQIKLLEEYPVEYNRLKDGFTLLRKKLKENDE